MTTKGHAPWPPTTACSSGRCPTRDRLRLRGLDPDARYEVTAWDAFDAPLGSFERGGDELMRVGIGIEPPDPSAPGTQPPDGVRIVRGDFTFRLFDLRRI